MDFADPNSSRIDKDSVRHGAVGMDPEHAASARLDAAITKTRRMMISVNSGGRRPHPQETTRDYK